MDRQGEALCQRELGISQALFLVLSVVDAFPGPLSQQAVADRLGLTKGTVSRQIEHAVAAGLMTVSLAPTEAGAALVRRGDALMETSRAAMLGAIDPRDLPAALRLLGRVVESLA